MFSQSQVLVQKPMILKYQIQKLGIKPKILEYKCLMLLVPYLLACTEPLLALLLSSGDVLKLY